MGIPARMARMRPVHTISTAGGCLHALISTGVPEGVGQCHGGDAPLLLAFPSGPFHQVGTRSLLVQYESLVTILHCFSCQKLS